MSHRCLHPVRLFEITSDVFSTIPYSAESSQDSSFEQFIALWEMTNYQIDRVVDATNSRCCLAKTYCSEIKGG